jgi:hypothetical protein
MHKRSAAVMQVSIVSVLGLLPLSSNASQILFTAPSQPLTTDPVEIEYRITANGSPIAVVDATTSIEGGDIAIRVRTSSATGAPTDLINVIDVGSLAEGDHVVKLYVSRAQSGTPDEFQLEAVKPLTVQSVQTGFANLNVVGGSDGPGAIALTADWKDCGNLQRPVISRDGNTVTVKEGYSALCSITDVPSRIPVILPLGEFSAGSYTLHFVSFPVTNPSSPTATTDPPIDKPFTVNSAYASFSGLWYDPTQSGQGVVLEVQPNDALAAWWLTFTPDGGQQSWFGGVGQIDTSTNSASIDAIIESSGRFYPNFDPTKIVRSDWGTMRFVFGDCNHIRLYFDSKVGYGAVNDSSAGIPLVRLTQPAGLSCSK